MMISIFFDQTGSLEVFDYKMIWPRADNYIGTSIINSHQFPGYKQI